MQGIKRRVVYVTLYELIAIVVTSFTLAFFSDQNVAHASVAAFASTTIAIIWNVIFNTVFEYWESKQNARGRNLARRIVHAIGFEGGLILALVPLYAWWLGISLKQAFIMDIGLIIFFLCYTFIFNLAFDKIFGLPASALTLPQNSSSN